MALTHYRLVVWDEGGTQRFILGMNNELAGIDSVEWTPAGDGLEMVFSGMASTLDIQERDMVQLSISENSGSTWTPFFLGTAVKYGNTRSAKLSRYKLAGARKLLYETAARVHMLRQADVAEQVWELFTVPSTGGGLNMPGRLFFDSTDTPLQTFINGDRFVYADYVGAILDALAETVPGFTVQAGGSYTYDGITYNPTDVVPATLWGVTPEGKVFFSRSRTNTLNLTEGTGGVVIDWKDGNAESIVDVGFLVLGRQVSDGSDWLYDFDTFAANKYRTYVPGPIIYEYDGGTHAGAPTVRDRIVELPFDLGLWKKENLSISTDSGWESSGNAIDGNTATGGARLLEGDGLKEIKFNLVTAPVHVFHVVWRNDTPEEDGRTERVWLRIYINYDGTGFTYTNATWPLTLTDGENRDMWLIVPHSAPMLAKYDYQDTEIRVGTNNILHAAFGSPNVEVDFDLIEVTAYTPDAAQLDRRGQNEITQAAIDPAVVLQYGVLPTLPASTINLTHDGGGPTPYDVKSIFLHLNRPEGVLTRYAIGQRLDSEDAAEADLLNQRFDAELRRNLELLVKDSIKV